VVQVRPAWPVEDALRLLQDNSSVSPPSI
jgi:hypothetical protein